MAYQVLARKYRPLRFSDVIGQDHVTHTLLNALQQDRIAHGYIFSGHRGIGKTTIARILASALNCRRAIGSADRPTPEPCNSCESCLEIRQGSSIDVIEIDAATNRGIDEIRELRDAARYRPARDRFKIYILDEAHQITDAAFNALLKTLEEPPDHIVFMMATTQPEDIPQTIRSRCQHFSFHAVKLDDIVGQLRKISADEHLLVDDGALALLAEAGDGSMRDALSIMDQAIASAPLVDGQPELATEQVRALMGSVSNVVFEQMLAAVDANDSAGVLGTVATLLDAGNGAQQIARQFVRFLRNALVAKITSLPTDADTSGLAAELLQISTEERRRAARSAAAFTEEELSRFLAIMLRTFDDLGYRQEQRLHLELGLLKLVHAQRLVPVERILSQLGANLPTGRDMTAPAARTAPRPAAASTATPAPKPATQAGQRSSPLAPEVLQYVPEVPSATPAPRTRTTAAIASPTPVQSTVVSLALAESDAPAKPPAAAGNTPSPKADAGPHPLPSQPTADIAPLQESGPSAEATAWPSLDALQAAVVEGLEAVAGQRSAADALQTGEWTMDGVQILVRATLSAPMVATLFSKATLDLVHGLLRAAGATGMRLTVQGDSPASAGKSRAPRKAAAGSVAALAASHPLVQQAQQLFGGEITTVHDLRDK